MNDAERDPHGTPPHEPGAKLDAGKPQMSLCILGFARAQFAVGEVCTYGAKKYTKNGWMSVPNGQQRYTDAMLRHLLAETREKNDPESGIPHAAAVAWNAMARLELMLREKENVRVSDGADKNQAL